MTRGELATLRNFFFFFFFLRGLLLWASAGPFGGVWAAGGIQPFLCVVALSASQLLSFSVPDGMASLYDRWRGKDVNCFETRRIASMTILALGRSGLVGACPVFGALVEKFTKDPAAAVVLTRLG